MTRRNDALPWIALIAVYVLWGSTYIGIRVAVATIPPFLMTGVRYTIAGALLLALQWLFAKTKPPMPTPTQVLQIGIIAVALLTIGNGLLCLAETRVEAGTAALLIASSPIFMVLLDALQTRRRPHALAFTGILLGAIGIAALIGKFPSRTDALLAALVVGSSFAWAAGSVYARGVAHHPFTASLEMLAGGALSVLAGLAIGEASRVRIEAISPVSLWGMLWLIFGGAMIGYSAFAYALRTLPASTVATYGYVNPVVAVILGATLLHEPVTWHIVAGGAAVVASVALILVGNRRVAEDEVAVG